MRTTECITTQQGNTYFYSPCAHSFHFLSHNGSEYVNKSEVSFGISVEKRKHFWEQVGLFQQNKPYFVTCYSKEMLERNLANMKQLLIEVTDACNLSCRYCGYGDFYKNHDRRNNKNQDFEGVKPLIDYLYPYWNSPLNISYSDYITVGFYGGEPLVNFQLIREVIDYLESLSLSFQKFRYNMTTNAVLLDKYMDYLVEKDFILLISLDGNKFNNSYRVRKDGSSSFETVVQNALKLKNKYPAYFEDNVSFNAVLHNRNSVEEIVSFIWETFGKVARVGELSTNEIADEKRDEFWEMFNDKLESFKQACGNKDLQDKLSFAPAELELNTALDAFTDNTYTSYRDLFRSADKEAYIPTGTCPPFQRKLFLTVNGKILPCEKVGQYVPLGYVRDGKVALDLEQIIDFYHQKYEQLITRCSQCFQWKHCGLCIYYMKEINGKLKCPGFQSKTEAAKVYCSSFLSYLEAHPQAYGKVMNELLID